MMQGNEKVVLHEEDIGRALTRIAHEIIERNPGDPAPALVGIHSRGAFLAKRLHASLQELLGADVALGDLDIGFYRDDVATRPDAPVLHASHIDFDITGLTVVIVDDVLFTGRTVRAAIEALFDYGRPARVQLAVLADRGHRELPIRPDYVGKNLPTSRSEHVHVRLRELDGVDEVAIAAGADADADAGAAMADELDAATMEARS
jgi:pyrimidine operon attenuation protein/uracil phosphoribosyltransferase